MSLNVLASFIDGDSHTEMDFRYISLPMSLIIVLVSKFISLRTPMEVSDSVCRLLQQRQQAQLALSWSPWLEA